MATRLWKVPEGLAVRPDGSWRVGELHVIHPPTLRYLKSHLVFEDGGAGRFHCVVRDGRAQAVLSRGAHQTLLAHAGQEGGRFFLRAGERRLRVRA